MVRTLRRLSLLCLLLPLLAEAQVPQSITLDSIFVAAQAVNPAATITTVPGEIAEQRNVAVAYDALAELPGLHVPQRLGLTGTGLTRLLIRGAGWDGPAGLIVHVDGRPDATVSFAHPIPQAHNIASIDWIDVVHGPSPVLHGAGNTGVVLIRSREPGPGASGSVTASGGSFGTFENFADLGYGWDRGFVAASGSYRRTDGHLPDTDAWIASGQLRTAYQLSPEWRLRLAALHSVDHFRPGGPFAVPGPFSDAEQLDLTQTTGDLALEGQIGTVNTRAGVWGNRLLPRSQNPPEGADRALVYELGMRLRATAAPWTGGQVILGTDVLHARARNTPRLPPTAGLIDVDLTELGPYAFVQQRLLGQLTLNGGVRLTHHSAYGTEPSGEAGLVYRFGGAVPGAPLGETVLRARAVRGFQSPTLQQLYGVFRGGLTGVANPDLQPERVTQFEAGIEQAFALGHVRVVGFLQQGDNLIVPREGRLANVGEFSHPGVEAWGRLRPIEGLMLDLGLTYIDLEDTVLRVPHTTVDFGAIVRPAALRPYAGMLSLYGRYASQIYDQRPNQPIERLDDYLVLNAKLSGNVWHNVTAFVEVDNLTDTAYETILGYPMPGRSAYVGLSLRW